MRALRRRAGTSRGLRGASKVDEYRLSETSGEALKLVPLVQVGPTPKSAKNACYFFSRLEQDGARCISYHYIDQPELRGQFDEATETIKFLMAE